MSHEKQIEQLTQAVTQLTHTVTQQEHRFQRLFRFFIGTAVAALLLVGNLLWQYNWITPAHATGSQAEMQKMLEQLGVPKLIKNLNQLTGDMNHWMTAINTAAKEQQQAGQGDMANNIVTFINGMGGMITEFGMASKGQKQTFGGSFVENMVTLGNRLKQDSDVMRMGVLEKANNKQGQDPDDLARLMKFQKFAAQIGDDQLTAELNKPTTSPIYVVQQGLVDEIEFINTSLMQLNFNMSVMAKDMDSTMGRMGRMMSPLPWGW
ncbi:hypothetical protein ACQZV8_16270 [Magnetococcales bacterium HHB-1]